MFFFSCSDTLNNKIDHIGGEGHFGLRSLQGTVCVCVVVVTAAAVV